MKLEQNVAKKSVQQTICFEIQIERGSNATKYASKYDDDIGGVHYYLEGTAHCCPTDTFNAEEGFNVARKKIYNVVLEEMEEMIEFD